MDTLAAITTRRAVRSWTDKPVSEKLVNSILEAGNSSPSPLNSQPWHFIVIRDKEMLAKLSTTARHASFLSGANLAIIVTSNIHPAIDEWLGEHDQHFYAAAGSLFLMWLAAWNAGLGGCWVTIDEKAGKDLLHIPGSHRMIGGLALGYPKKIPPVHVPDDRKPLSSVVSRETF